MAKYSDDFDSFDDFDDFDGEINTGIDTSEFDSINESESLSDQENLGNSNNFENTGQDDIESSITNKKAAIISVAAGLFVVAIAFIILGNIVNKKQEPINQVQQPVQQQIQQVQQPVQQQIQQPTVDQNTQQFESDSINNTSEQNISDSIDVYNSINEKNEWIAFNDNLNLEFNLEAEADFTVTSIQNYVKVANADNDKIIKSVVKGNISGLVGTYEVELPYDKASKLDTGTLIKMKYRYCEDKGSIIVGELIF